MSLIKELGGYEKAKEVQKQRALDGLLHDYDWELFDELLEYRRANNIFEVGDWFVVESNNPKPHKLTLDDIGSHWIGLVNIRHATGTEIKQGIENELLV